MVGAGENIIASWASDLLDLEQQIEDLQTAKRDLYSAVREEHGKPLAAGLKQAVKLSRMEAEKRDEMDAIDSETHRILGIIEAASRAPRATRVEIIDEIPPALPVAADRATEATPPASVATQSEPSGLARSDPQRSVSSTREGERLDGFDPITQSATTADPAGSDLTPAASRPNSSPMTGADTGETVSTPVSPVAIPRKPFRPHCLDRQACAGMGNHHCNRCERAYLAKLDPVG